MTVPEMIMEQDKQLFARSLEYSHTEINLSAYEVKQLYDILGGILPSNDGLYLKIKRKYDEYKAQGAYNTENKEE